MANFFSFEIDTQNVKTDTFNFLRRMRNSIAHVNYEVNESMMFTFRDRDPRSEPEGGLEMTIGRNKLMEFLSKFGADLANLRTIPLRRK